ncbi:MAG: iron-containing alcohol dehydrogenase [Verrucomicrobiae bacterium]|nr:iron-containing alcohol dehydrogenase [Verrucomicrobiae bacterium]
MTTAGDPSPIPGLAPFDFASPTRIVFGPGTVRHVGGIARQFGKRALVVTGSQPARARPVLESLAAEGITSDTFAVPGEPTTLHVASGVARARLRGFDVIVGFGGGSALDAAKAIAGLLTNERDLYDYLEVVGRAQPLARPSAPWIAIPTTAGAGAEVTRNAVLTAREHRVKASLRSPFLLAHAALVDPELTLPLPPAITAQTGLDALTQLIEPFVSLRANPFTDALCQDGLPRVAASLLRACQDGGDLPARSNMALAALFGGFALANAGLGVVHGLAAPIGGAHPAPHGAVCAALLPHAMAVNLAALRQRHPNSPALDRYDTVARTLLQDPGARADDAVAWVLHLTRSLAIPPLRQYGIEPDHFGTLADQAAQASSMKTNPVSLTREEGVALLTAAW